jgi:CrcB protein
MVGSFILGFLTASATHLSPALTATTGIGFCGALTTYSTFSYETLRLLENGARFYAVANVGASLLGGFGAVGLGWTLGTWLT